MSGAGNTFGTQSPPLQDAEPLGVSNIKGDKAPGIPDAKQREQYFTAPSDGNETAEDQSQSKAPSADKIKKE